MNNYREFSHSEQMLTGIYRQQSIMQGQQKLNSRFQTVFWVQRRKTKSVKKNKLFYKIRTHSIIAKQFINKRYVYQRCHFSSLKRAYITLNITLNPNFIQQNWGLQGYTLFFLFMLKNIDCGYSLEPPHRGGSNEYPQSMFWAEIWKISKSFYMKMFSFWW